jgi:cell division protein FtsW
MAMKERFDRFLLAAAILQTAAGLAVLASASWVIATERYHRHGSYFVSWQAATAVVGLAILIIAMHVKLELLTHRRTACFALGATWILLIVALLQPPVANTHRWLGIGGLSVQPSVLARLALILFAAVHIDLARREGWSHRRLATVAAAAAVTGALVVCEPDLGSSVLLVLAVAAVAFVAGVPARFLVPVAVVGGIGLIVAIASSPYRLARLLAFLGVDHDAAASWQTYQSLIALGSGGVLGKGYGAGLQKLFFLPEPHTDFVFSIVGEELGLIGVLAVLTLAATITWRGLRIAVHQTVPARALLAFGLTFVFALQTLIHVVVCLNLLPPKGIPLPLISYGKTDLVVTLASIGLLLNLSREVNG